MAYKFSGAGQYTVAIGVNIDPSGAKQGAVASVAAVDTIGTAAERNTSKLQALINKQIGIGTGPANANVREWTGALAAQGKSIDDLRAKYNPLFAVIRDYKTSLTEIRTLQAQGILKTDEMTAAITRQRQATLASIDAIKGRNRAVGSEGRPNFGNQSNPANVGFQLFDILQTAPFMSAGMVGFQQGPQLAQALGGQDFKGALSTLGAGLATVANPLSLVTIGLTTAAAAAIQLGVGFLSSSKQADNFDQVLQRHSSTVSELATRWGELVEKSSQFGRSSAVVGFGVEMNSAQLRKTLREQVDTVLQDVSSATSANLSEIGGASAFRQQPMFSVLTDDVGRLVKAAKAGSPDIVGLTRRISEMARTSDNSGVRKLADDIVVAIGPVEELARKLLEAEQARIRLFNSVGPNGRMLSQGLIAQAESTNTALFENRNRIAAERSRQVLEAQLYQIAAKSPQDQAEAARRSEAARYDMDETAAQRRTRIENAGKLALAQAEKQLGDAQQQRLRSLDNSLSSRQLELSLIGKTRAETERLRMQYQLTTQLKEEAARNGTTVDQDELEAIRQKSAAYGKLAEEIAAAENIQNRQFTLETLRVETQLLGQSEDVRRRVLDTLRTEQELKRQGIALDSERAAKIREQSNEETNRRLALEKTERALARIRSTGESLIDNVFDKLLDGEFDPKSILKDTAKNVAKLVAEMSASQPLRTSL